MVNLDWAKPRLLSLFLLLATALFADDAKEEHSATPPPPENGYTINYDTVSIIQYIKFASKICKANFIYNEADLNFSVSVVSDAPITPSNVMATLLQVLRINGLYLLEQDNNLVIHKSDDVKQIATLVTSNKEGMNVPIVTRVFRVTNIPIESLDAIIRPMISTSALLETAPETHVMILTDLTANVNKVADLIEILDSPHAPLEIKSYEIQNNSPEFLIDMANQLMVPIASGQPFILVPQPLANAIFIVSTPDLVTRANAILTSLDTPPKKSVVSQRKLKSENIFVYTAINRPGNELLTGLNDIANNMVKSGIPEGDLIDTIETARFISQTNSIVFFGSTNSIAKVKEFLTSLDTPTTATPEPRFSFFVYKPQNRSAEELQHAILAMGNNLKGSKGADESLIDTIESAKVTPSTNTIVFSGDEKNFPRVKELLATIDTPTGKGPPPGPTKYNFFVYKIQQAPASAIESSLKNLATSLDKSNVSDEGLIEAINKMKYIPETHSILFTGPDTSLKRLQELLPTFDSSSVPISNQFLIYKPKNQKGEQLVTFLKEVTDNLKSDSYTDPAFIQTLQSMKWVKANNSLLFTGDAASIKKVETLIASLDVPGAAKPFLEKTFFLYHPQYASREKTETYLKQVSDNLNKRRDEDLIDTIRSAKWIDSSKSFMFQGSDASINRIKELLQTFDVPIAAQPAVPKSFFLYQPHFFTRSQMEEYLDQVATNLSKKGMDEELVNTIHSMKWVEPSQSFMFQGNDTAIARLKELLQNFDTSEEKRGTTKSGYAIYKLQNTTGDGIEDDIDNLIKNFKASGVKDTKLIDVLEKARYVKETNSLLLTGDPKAIEEAKKLIAEYDIPRAAAPINSNFFMYKPQSIPAPQIEQSLKDVAANLQKADLADPPFLSAIKSMKYVEATNSLIFTGTPDALQKVQTLIKDIDVPPEKHVPIQRVGKTTFLLYKLKNASGPQVISSLKAMTADFKKSGTSDKDFIAALQSVKYVKETNSLLFTGNEEALLKVESFVEKFDVTSLAAPTAAEPLTPLTPGASDFLLYKPVSVPGTELEKMMLDFSENLKMSGLADPDLFNAIRSMRWVDKTQSFVFTGTPKALNQVKQLLASFDIAANLADKGLVTPLEPSIQAIDNTSFLVYKLQFHKGDEIQGALRQIARDLTISNAPINQNLLNSINSIQWLEVTNSLLCSGDQETLIRLRELIKNLDIALKQVYIEMLVIETSLTNALQFGLEWGGKYKYRNKFQGSINNTLPQLSSQDTCTPDAAMSTLNNLVPVSPAPAITSQIPFGCGFDLGVIGQVIKHNGQTFLTLGSLLSAVQTDDETAVVITPKIITQDGRTSNIFVGQNIPFVGSFVNNQGTNVVQTSNLEYRDVGLNLTITPVLGNSDIVTLDISLDRSQTVGDVTGSSISFTTQSAQGITTSRTTMQTTVHVPDKNFLILSGFVNNSNAKVKSGLPCLGGLPLIGAAFTQDSSTVQNTNIVIFLRPHIINSVDDLRRITADQEEAFRDQQGTPFLIRQFDEGMELIKTVDDE